MHGCFRLLLFLVAVLENMLFGGCVIGLFSVIDFLWVVVWGLAFVLRWA